MSYVVRDLVFEVDTPQKVRGAIIVAVLKATLVNGKWVVSALLSTA